ncbi:MAG: PPOX class F420-dependent oxidoreductase [Armatimonadota bacterium]|nr:PPOX class F420-dependent oxidoreductase [Armatimonadota bacterium]MDR7400979.1 PPOX class F420-dependent oxidoreductase [Armatimonadota bacterium]MDR7403461.1 PPOX class F420-dependent oxidoreductase [Armatimonadota bacterium]MDR7436691.1 PPOX class F420-dependent oxidoreductase [Armatimonadota bacterium]MDR7471237.1 PPOX class F420-dependent oxidoreductase [Armatimonadota bacterium]
MRLPDHIRAFLDAPYLAVLATVGPRGRPQATPVWFALDGDEILMNTTAGRVKLRNLQRRPYASVVVLDPGDPDRYVQIRGPVRLDPAHGAQDIDRLSLRYEGRPFQYPPTDAPHRRVSIRLRPESYTAVGLE